LPFVGEEKLKKVKKSWMRPRIVDFLNSTCNTSIFHYVIPIGTIVYVLAMIVVMWVFVKRCEKSKLSTYHALGASIYAMLCGIIGARLFYILQHLDRILDNPIQILSLGGGTASWGAYFGGSIGFIFYLYLKKLDILTYFDVLFSAVGLGPFIGRWACFLNGCCFGTVTKLPWGVRFPKFSSAYNSHLKLNLINESSLLSLPVHPVQIYSSLFTFALFILASIFWHKFKGYKGLTVIFYLFLYSIIRFFIEFLRGDVPRYTSLAFTFSQIICLVIIIVSLIVTGFKYHEITLRARSRI
jgi:phosphatidylglycerol:prolipoprotein diacylglycerol transferase